MWYQYSTKVVYFLTAGKTVNLCCDSVSRQLFRIDGVKGVMLGPDFITISKVNLICAVVQPFLWLMLKKKTFSFQADSDLEWKVIKPDVFATIMDFFTSGVPVINEESVPSADTGESSTNFTGLSSLNKESFFLLFL